MNITLGIEWTPTPNRPWRIRRIETNDYLRDMSRTDGTQPAYAFRDIPKANAFIEKLRRSAALRRKAGL